MTPQPTRKKTSSAPLDEATRAAKAFSHPLRGIILDRLNDRVSSPVELARELDAPLGNVSYHVQVLLELDCIELVETVPRRGAVEHRYRATRRTLIDDDTWAALPPSVRRGFMGEWFRKTTEDLVPAMEAGGFNRADCHFSFTRLVLDEQAWSELSKELIRVYERAIELQAEAAGRLQAGATGGAEMDARLVMAEYERATEPAMQARRSRRGAKTQDKPEA